MNLKAIIPLGLAVVLGLAAAVLVRNALVRHAAVPQPPSNLVAVVVAARDVSPGMQLAAEDLVIAKVPADATPGQVYSDPATLINRVVTTPIVKGQTVLDTLLAAQGTGSGLQALIPEGRRAITLEVSEFSAVGGMLLPGCHVDVLGVMRDEKIKSSVARTILQDITITAVGRTLSTGAPPTKDANGNPLPPANHVTLLVTPKEGQTLQLAMQMGRPWLVLRNSHDDSAVTEDATTLAQLLGQSDDNGGDSFVKNAGELTHMPANTTAIELPAQPAAASTTQPVSDLPQPIRRVVQVLHGSTESQVVFTLPPSANRHATAGIDTGVFPQ